MSRPQFSPDGARIAYGTHGELDFGHLGCARTWGAAAPVFSERLGAYLDRSRSRSAPPFVFRIDRPGPADGYRHLDGEPRPAAHCLHAAAEESGMAHRSYLSPDRKQVLLAEMDASSWLPCRLTPFDGSSPGKPVGPAPAQCTDAAWSPDGKWMYFYRQYRQRISHLAAEFPGRDARASHLRRHARRGNRIRSRRALLRHFDRPKPEHAVVPRFARRSADHFGRLRSSSVPLSRWQEAVLPAARRRSTELCERRTLGRGPGIRTAPAAAARLSDAALHHLRVTASAWCLSRRTTRGALRCGWRRSIAVPRRGSLPPVVASWRSSARAATCSSWARRRQTFSSIASKRTAVNRPRQYRRRSTRGSNWTLLAAHHRFPRTENGWW